MRQIRSVMDAVSGGMGEQDIKSAVPPKRKPQAADATVHFALCVLVFALLIADGAAQTENSDAAVAIDLIFDADAAEWRTRLVHIVVVTVYIQHGSVRIGCNKGQIIGREIAAG